MLNGKIRQKWSSGGLIFQKIMTNDLLSCEIMLSCYQNLNDPVKDHTKKNLTMIPKVKILFAEDILVHHRMAVETLKHEGIQFDSTWVDKREDFINALRSDPPDIVITDYSMPDFNGMDALKLTLEFDDTIPVIILTGSISEEVAVECMHSGAANYVLKENLIRLPFAVKSAVQRKLAILEKNRAIQALTESESKLHTVTNAAGDAIIMIDNEGIVSFWNPAAEKIFGFPAAEAIGNHLHTMIAPVEFQRSYDENFARFQRDGSGNAIGKTLELEAIRKDGRRINISLNLSAVQMGGKWHAVGIASDITDRIKAAEELLAAKRRAEQSDHLKTVFINNISHEVRTPLNGVLGFAELIIQPDLTPDEKQEFINLLKSSTSRLVNTMTCYMDISMLVSGNMQVNNHPFRPQAVIENLYAKFLPSARIKDLRFFTDIPPGGEHYSIISDSDLHTKLLAHLVDNAMKFTHQGEIRLGFSVADDKVVYLVSDTGIGISEELMPVIFDHFIQEEVSNSRNYEGSGLGLTIVRGLVSLLNGKIDIISEKGTGTTIRVELPGKPIQKGKDDAQEPEMHIPLTATPLILIAEDDEANYLLLVSMFRKSGYEILRARTGAEAVEKCMTNSDISLVLMDMKMPEMDGLEATRLIKEHNPALPVVAVTAYAMSGDRERALKAGCNDYISKPVIREVLLKKIGALFGNKP